MQQYLDLMRNVLEHGSERPDRTGTRTLSLFGTSLRFDMSDGSFPLMTTKAMSIRSILGELAWFLSGSTNVYELAEITFGDREHRTIWTDNYNNQAKEIGLDNGELGRIYGAQWRSWNHHIDQIAELVRNLCVAPYSRRHLVTAWNPSELEEMSLPPCHYAFQCYIDNGVLSLMWQQRSVDLFLGLPYNIASYAALLLILCNVTGYNPGELVFNGGDTHIYLNHIDQCKEQLSRKPLPLPKLKFAPMGSTKHAIEIIKDGEYELTGYDPYPKIRAQMAI